MADIYGTPGDDILNGTVEDDYLYGDAGNDAIAGDGGNDIIDGSFGNDVLTGGEGADVINSGDGDDVIYADMFDTSLHGGAGHDVLYSEEGMDITWYLGTLGHSGFEEVHGASGNDLLAASDMSDVCLYGEAGLDTLFGSMGNDFLSGGVGDDRTFGGAGDDTYIFNLGDGTDTVSDISTAGEENRIRFGVGITVQDLTFTQEAGIALRINVETSGDAIRLIGFDATNTSGSVVTKFIEFADGTRVDLVDLLNNAGGVSQIIGTQFGDYLLGTPQAQEIQGLGGNDDLYGLEGDDVLLGGTGNDNLDGGLGNDVLNGGTGNDLLQDSSGSDTYVWGASSGVDRVQDSSGDVTEVDTVLLTPGVTPGTLFVTQDGAANPGGLTLRLALSDDQLIIHDLNSIEQLQFADGTVWDQVTIQAHIQQVQTGTAWNDFLGGGAQADYLLGLGGDDIVFGGDGHDALLGGAGKDYLDGGLGNDVLNGGTGNDVLQDFSGSDTYVWGAGSGVDTVQDSSGDVTEVDTVLLTPGVTPGTLFVTQDGAANPGGLTLRLALSDDQLIIQDLNSIEQFQFADGTVWDQATIQARIQQVQKGTASNDVLYGVAANNYLSGQGGDDRFYGSSGSDALLGGSGNDQLDGATGDDVLNGGSGDDHLFGSGGNDTYIFGIGSGQDTVDDVGAVGEVDTVLVMPGVTPSTLFVTQDGATNAGGLTLRLAQSDDQLIIQDVNSIELLQFADGTVWDQAAIQARIQQVQTGTAGNDFLGGSLQGDYLLGLGGDDNLVGVDGHDVLLGGAGDDHLYGDAGNDVFNGGAGNDFLQDGAGSDTYQWGVGNGVDTLQDWAGDVAEVDTVLLTSEVTPDTLFVTQDGATNPGGLVLRLALSDDQLIIQDLNSIEQLQFADGTIWDQAVIQARIQQLQIGTLGNDILSAYAVNNYLDGGAGDDTLSGANGIDALFGGAGSDQLSGFAGDDVYDGGAGNDSMQDFGGSDTYLFGLGSGHDTVTDFGVFGEIDTLQLTEGVNESDLVIMQDISSPIGGTTIILTDSSDRFQVQHAFSIEQFFFTDGTIWDAADIQAHIQQVSLSGTEANDILFGSTLGDHLKGFGGSDTLDGRGGHDYLDGGTGADVMSGGQGDDTYLVDNASDEVSETVNEGTDTIHSSVTYTLSANVENLTLTGTAAINGRGNLLDNVLVGNSATNRLSGGIGDDTYIVGAGDTIVESNRGGVDTAKSSVTWTLGSHVENLTLIGAAAINGTGNSVSNVMHGNAAANTLSGKNGNDTLAAGQGNDILNGGEGNDTYLFGRGEGQDLVQDSGGSADKLRYDSGINPLDLVISRQASDLRLSIHGSTDYVTVQNWYTSSSNRTETIQAGNGQTLLSTQVDQLIQAMASFSQQSGLTWDQAIDQQPTQVQSILAASWQ